MLIYITWHVSQSFVPEVQQENVHWVYLLRQLFQRATKKITVTEMSIIRESPERTASYPCTGSCVSKFLTLVLPHRMHSGLFYYRNDIYEKLSLVQGQITMRGILFGYNSLKSSLPKDQTPFLLYCLSPESNCHKKTMKSNTLIISSTADYISVMTLVQHFR